MRSRIIQSLREFFVEKDFLEVETPMMQPIPGAQRPGLSRPITMPWAWISTCGSLRSSISKRLVVGGLERVFEINRNFRNEGISIKHNPEFTMLEFYMAYATYEDLMVLTESLFNMS